MSVGSSNCWVGSNPARPGGEKSLIWSSGEKEAPCAFWRHWAGWVVAKLEQLSSSDRLRRDLGRMSERDLWDIGLIRSDIDRITHGRLPPTDRPLS